MPPTATPKSSRVIVPWPRTLSFETSFQVTSRCSLAVESNAVPMTAAASDDDMNRSSASVVAHDVFTAPSTPRISTETGNVGARASSSATTALKRSCTSAPSALIGSPILTLDWSDAWIHKIRISAVGSAMFPACDIG